MNSGLWSKLLKKTVITATFYFPADEEKVCIRKQARFGPNFSHKIVFGGFSLIRC